MGVCTDCEDSKSVVRWFGLGTIFAVFHRNIPKTSFECGMALARELPWRRAAIRIGCGVGDHAAAGHGWRRYCAFITIFAAISDVGKAGRGADFGSGGVERSGILPRARMMHAAAK